MRWSDPASWPELGRVPTASDVATIPAGRTIALDTMTAAARRLSVYGTLTKLDGVNVQLTMYGNLVVDQGGFVDFSRADGSTWLVQFIVASERQFVGGGNVVLESDTGWWVTGAGRVNLQGSPKTAWTRLVGAASAGQSQITVLSATGWRAGDEIAVVPTESPAVQNSFDLYDVRTIAAVSGNTITLAGPLAFNHPVVTVRPGMTYTAEVLNLTRTGRIEGRPGLRTHFWIRNTSAPAQPQVIRFVQFRHGGPQSFDSNGNLNGVLGRYGGPHFHMNGDFSNGSLVEGTVTRDFGLHAYVPHDSNGITFQGNIAHDGFDSAFWFDNGPGHMGPSRTTYLGNVASRVRFIPAYRGYRMTGFFLGQGSNNVARDNIAVGVQGSSDASGFAWPDGSPSVWTFDRGNVAHNNRVNGLFAWQNDNRPHAISNFVAYHNGRGIEHGAYLNDYLYQDITLYGNGNEGILLHALSNNTPGLGLRFIRVYIDAFGRDYAIRTARHSLPGRAPVNILNSTFTNYRRAGILFSAISGAGPEWFVIGSSTFSGNKYWLMSTIPAGSLIVDMDEALQIRRVDQPGTLMAAWNARVTTMVIPR
jgi:hypothetical protein